jgi:hypothetical protein
MMGMDMETAGDHKLAAVDRTNLAAVWKMSIQISGEPIHLHLRLPRRLTDRGWQQVVEGGGTDG